MTRYRSSPKRDVYLPLDPPSQVNQSLVNAARGGWVKVFSPRTRSGERTGNTVVFPAPFLKGKQGYLDY